MNIIDAVIIVLLIVGALTGFRKGVISSLVSLVGTIVVLVVAYYLKNPVAEFLYTNLPVINLGGIFNGVAVINILIYELIAFLLVVGILFAILQIILKVTGLVEKLLKLTIVFGVISKFLGAIVGIIEMYVIVFVTLFILNQPFFNITGINDSMLSPKILNKTPLLSNMVKDVNITMDGIWDLKESYVNKDKTEFNYSALDLMLKNNLVTIDSVKILKEKDKLSFDGLDELISKYGG